MYKYTVSQPIPGFPAVFDIRPPTRADAIHRPQHNNDGLHKPRQDNYSRQQNGYWKKFIKFAS